MIILTLFAFFAGIVTILSPCILPILPIILTSSFDSSGKKRPLGVVIGFVFSFTFFTLFLSSIVKLTGIPSDSLRFFSIVILFIFGLSLISSKIQEIFEKLFARLSRFTPNGQNKFGFWGGFVIGLSLGLLWTPCVGPILASVISLAISGTITGQAIVITLAYAIGTAIPMFIIMQTGNVIVQKAPWLLKNSSKIQKFFGVIMILLSISIYLNLDRRFQTFILNTFPNYGTNLTKFEEQAVVKKTVDEKMKAPEIIEGGIWFNTAPIKISELRGKVVLIDFWTYTCINCQRTLPYVEKWYEKYKDKGLVVIGVHTPEFEFEKDTDNLRKAINDFGLTYPIIQDNNYETWNAYNNHYWPAKYFINKDGIIVSSHFGEGDYDKSEKLIQQLLGINEEVNNPTYEVSARTPETYLGLSRRSYNFNSYVTLSGKWNQMEEYSNPQTGSKLELKFNAKNVYLVMRPKNKSSKVNIYLDGEFKNTVNIDSDKLYDLIDLDVGGNHTLTIEFLDNDTEVFAFTFG